MKIELMGRKIEAGSKEQEEMKVGKVILSEKEITGIEVLADRSFESLHEAFYDRGNEFMTYMGIASCIAENNPYLALDLICALLNDNGCGDMKTMIVAFIPKETEHVSYFVNHFCAMMIYEMIEEEEDDDWDDKANPNGFVLRGDVPCVGCFGASFEDCCKCGHKERDSHE